MTARSASRPLAPSANGAAARGEARALGLDRAVEGRARTARGCRTAARCRRSRRDADEHVVAHGDGRADDDAAVAHVLGVLDGRGREDRVGHVLRRAHEPEHRGRVLVELLRVDDRHVEALALRVEPHRDERADQPAADDHDPPPPLARGDRRGAPRRARDVAGRAAPRARACTRGARGSARAAARAPSRAWRRATPARPRARRRRRRRRRAHARPRRRRRARPRARRARRPRRSPRRRRRRRGGPWRGGARGRRQSPRRSRRLARPCGARRRARGG